MLSATFPKRRQIMADLFFQDVTAGSNQDHRTMTWLGKVSLADLDARAKQDRTEPTNLKKVLQGGKIKQNKWKRDLPQVLNGFISQARMRWASNECRSGNSSRPSKFHFTPTTEILQMRYLPSGYSVWLPAAAPPTQWNLRGGRWNSVG